MSGIDNQKGFFSLKPLFSSQVSSKVQGIVTYLPGSFERLKQNTISTI
jgi:hypothetical protein